MQCVKIFAFNSNVTNNYNKIAVNIFNIIWIRIFNFVNIPLEVVKRQGFNGFLHLERNVSSGLAHVTKKCNKERSAQKIHLHTG